ncbi:unnamed protein product [Pylaiella littoralis]
MSGLSEPVGCNTVGSVSFFFGLIGGTGCSIVMKMLYQMSSKDLEGQERRFEKPLFLTFIMFVAMAGALPIYFVQQQQLKKKADRPPKVPSRVLLWLIIPSIFDLAGTSFAQTGLVFTTVSYYQLLRCTVIVVTAFLKAFVLHQRLASYMWWGVGINILAMVLVSVTNFIAPEDAQPDGASNPALGAFFILLSCVVQASDQYIFEEKVMAVDNAPPLIVIGMEGLWGTLIMLVILPLAAILPGRDMGTVENTKDTIYMMSQSYAIQVMLLVFFVTITMYNIFCIYVTAYLSAIWHAILDNFRPVSVWSADLVIYYMITNGAFGEAWTEYSWLQFSGMMVLFVGTAVYNGSLRLPFLEYGAGYSALHEPSTPGMRVPPSMATPSLMKSPLLRRMSHEYESPAGALTLAARSAARRAANAAVNAGGGGEGRGRAASTERLGLVKEGSDAEYGGMGDRL